MAPTEESILNNFLLLPAPLPAIISLSEFAALFPRSQQSSPHVRSLYRDLQNQRAKAIDDVTRNIAREIDRGKHIQREVVRLRREAQQADGDGGIDEEIEIEKALFGTDDTSTARQHTLPSILPDLESVVEAVHAESADLEDEEQALLQSIQQTVTDMQHLRYGQLRDPNLPQEILAKLEHIKQQSDKS